LGEWTAAVQDALLIGWREMPTAPGHVFYDRLNAVLGEAGFDRKVEALCAPHYAAKAGRPSVPPGRYFRMLFVGYFEGLDSERGIAWRCADSLSLRQFLQLGASEAVPDHSTLARTRARLPLEVHDAVFALVLRLVSAHGLVKGRRVGVDASTMKRMRRCAQSCGVPMAPAGRRCWASSPGPAGSRRPRQISGVSLIARALASGFPTPTGRARPTPRPGSRG
jgi:transposase